MSDIEERIRAAFRPYRSEVDSEDVVPDTTRRDARQRARRYREREITPPRTSIRVLTAAAALALFAVVVAVFVVPALRLGAPVADHPQGGGTVLPLWPVQTVDGLATYQAEADDGRHPEALDPKKLAERFGHQVLGWDQVFAVVHTSDDPVSNLCGLPGSDPAGEVGCWSPGLPWQGMAEDQPGYTPAPITMYALFHCEPGPCDIRFFMPVDVILSQPGQTGPNGVWAVMAASSTWLDLNTQPGETVHDGATVTASGSISHGDDFRLGASGAGSCGYAGSTDVYDTNGTPPDAESLDAHLDVHVGDTHGCSGSSAGYVWAAESETPLLGWDPLNGGGPPLKVFSAVPVTLVGS
jgi:hypothetical protein